MVEKICVSKLEKLWLVSTVTSLDIYSREMNALRLNRDDMEHCTYILFSPYYIKYFTVCQSKNISFITITVARTRHESQ